MVKSKTRILLVIIVLGIFLGYFFLNTDKFRPLLDINLWYLIPISLGYVALIISNGLLTKFILRPFNKDLPLKETTYIALITSVGNFFAPAGAGLAFRAVYLKKKHQVPYSDYISILTGNYLIVFLVNSFFGLIALFLLRSRADAHYKILVLTFLTMAIFSLILTTIKIPPVASNKHKNKRLARAVDILSKVSEGWRRIANNKGLLAQLVLITTLNLFLTVAIIWFIILSLSLSVGFAALLLFSVISMLSLFVNITPANLGIKEGLYIFSGSVLGFSINQIILIALIDRGVFFFLLFFSYLALRFSGTYRMASDN